MFSSILIAILALIGGLVVLAIGIVLTAYLLISWRLTLKLHQTVREMEALLAGAARHADQAGFLLRPQRGNVPPMRIHLEPVRSEIWADNELSHSVDQWLLAHSFQHLDDFRIAEIAGEFLRVYLSDDQRLVAAIRYPTDRKEPYVEFCFELAEDLRGGISNPPGASVPLPPDAIGKYFTGSLSEDFGLLSRMWLEAKDLVDEHDVLRVAPAEIATFFEAAHAAEMDFRIASGGVTEEEIRAALHAQDVEATESDIEEIQKQWQDAIEDHLLDYSNRGLMQHDAGREILIVHDGSAGNYLLDRVRALFESPHDYDQAQLREMAGELRVLLRKFSPREAMARFRPLLPVSMRYDLIDQLHQPVEADLYAFPGS